MGAVTHGRDQSTVSSGPVFDGFRSILEAWEKGVVHPEHDDDDFCAAVEGCFHVHGFDVKEYRIRLALFLDVLPASDALAAAAEGNGGEVVAGTSGFERLVDQVGPAAGDIPALASDAVANKDDAVIGLEDGRRLPCEGEDKKKAEGEELFHGGKKWQVYKQ